MCIKNFKGHKFTFDNKAFFIVVTVLGYQVCNKFFHSFGWINLKQFYRCPDVLEALKIKMLSFLTE